VAGREQLLIENADAELSVSTEWFVVRSRRAFLTDVPTLGENKQLTAKYPDSSSTNN
jgi:hypothetical protein